MPSIMQFYNQRERKTGNYPKLDVFLNLRIKRADIFVKYEHINYLLKNHGDFFSAADYPINWCSGNCWKYRCCSGLPVYFQLFGWWSR